MCDVAIWTESCYAFLFMCDAIVIQPGYSWTILDRFKLSYGPIIIGPVIQCTAST